MKIVSQIFHLFFLILSRSVLSDKNPSSSGGSYFLSGEWDQHHPPTRDHESSRSSFLHIIFQDFLDENPEKLDEAAFSEYDETRPRGIGRQISYKELNLQANQLARVLKEKAEKNW